ncbi:MAG: homoserine dehydrogenase [candidate division Zixibacteria bacterium]|nr:homoserine dehydrogenase [candidate division Zixibacteria bacterium]
MRLLLIGFGTVAQGLAELLIKKEKQLLDEYGLDITVVGISDMLKGSLYNDKGLDLSATLEKAKADGKISELPDKYDGDALSMIKDAEADMMVEATYTDIKTGEPATSHIRAALEKGMHVTTTNKGPVALFANELTKLAQNKGVKFLYEGTVMSGTPVLNLIRETLAGCEITEIKGILNGTTNYILSQMEAGQAYEPVLKKAQELGYAEAVPDADVLGWDALAKVTILVNVVFGGDCKPDDFPCKGITEITSEAIDDAKSRNKRFKLIGKVWREDGKVKGSVTPEEVDLTHPLAGVMGATNALTITTDALGDVTIVGPGAGRTETGYSTLVDIIHAGGKR